MEGHAELGSLMIVVAVAFVIPILLHRLKLQVIPVVVAEILAGLVIGKSGLNLVKEDPWLELLSLFGLIFLMFLSGLEIDFASFAKPRTRKDQQGGMRPIRTSFVISGAVMIASFLLAVLLAHIGLADDPYFMTIIIATISLGVVVPVLKEKKLLGTPLGQTILLVTVILDLVTMILLAVYISLIGDNQMHTLYLVLFFAIVVGFYFLARRSLKQSIFQLLRAGTVQIGTRGVFALILLFVVLSEQLQVEIILGAFLAGVIVSLLGPSRQFVHQLDSFGYGFLIPIFFVMIGADMELWSLLTDWKVLAFIPLLVAAIFVSKMVPVLILRRWYSWKHVFGSGILLSSTLSLVIAAATVAVEVGIIDETIQGALILVAILTCLAAPILFSQVFPEVEARKQVIALVGANHMTLPVSQELLREGYAVELYSAQLPAEASPEEKHSRFPVKEVERLDADSLSEAGLFDADVVVFGTMDDEVNLHLAKLAQLRGVERIIVRVEAPEHLEETQQLPGNVTVFSTLYASRTLMKALIEHPSAVKLITQHDDSIQEIQVNNTRYDQVYLRELPILGNTLIMRIYRGESVIIPHGATQIHVGDRLLVSGDVDQILDMKRELE